MASPYDRPIVLNPEDAFDRLSEPSARMYCFGAYGWTRLIVVSKSLEDGLELCAEWLVEHAPGLIVTPGQESEHSSDCFDADGQMIDHMCTEHGWIASWECSIVDIDLADSDYVEPLARAYIEQADPPVFDRFAICEAWHIWLSENHGGQGSREYARLCQLQSSFNPSYRAQRWWGISYKAATIYCQLVVKHSESEGQP